ncbi:hypothetical protein GCM10009872_25900 [Actinopolymorpha rutila]
MTRPPTDPLPTDFAIVQMPVTFERLPDTDMMLAKNTGNGAGHRQLKAIGTGLVVTQLWRYTEPYRKGSEGTRCCGS